jgi:hypothetical protein
LWSKSRLFFKLCYATVSYWTLVCVKVPVKVLIAIALVGYVVEVLQEELWV